MLSSCIPTLSVGGRTWIRLHRVRPPRFKEWDNSSSSVSAVSTANLPPAISTTGTHLFCARTWICYHRAFVPRSKEVDNLPWSRRVGRLHGRPAHRCLHSGQLVFDCDYTRDMFSSCNCTKAKTGEGVPTSSSCSRRFHDGPAPDCLHNRCLFLSFSRAGCTGYRPLPTRKNPNRSSKSIYVTQYISSCMHFLPAGRLLNGQLVFGL